MSALLNQWFRRLILAATDHRFVVRQVRRHGMRMGAARFVAGETIDDAVAVLRRLNNDGLHTNTTILGEGVTDAASLEAILHQYQQVLDRIAAEGLRTNIALKLSQLGLELDEELAYTNLERLVRYAAASGNFIRMDMEESFRVEATLWIYGRLRAAGHENVGMVLQSYLFRTKDDLAALLPLKPNLRLVKGAYLEPPFVAFPNKSDVDRAYVELAEQALLGGCHTCFATHDDVIIERLIQFAIDHQIDRSQFEFQMLYGVRPAFQLELVRRGYKVLVATPFGPEWYFYLMRRLAERPANLTFILRNLFRR